MNINYKNIYFWTPRFDEGSEGGEAGAGSTGGDAGGQTSFTQEQVNKIIAKERRTYQEKMSKLDDEINALKTRSNLNTDERKQLETRLEEIRNKSATENEKLSNALKKANKRYEEDTTALKAQATTWQDRFTKDRIRSELVSAAAKGDAYNPEQIVALLSTQTQLVERKDEEGNGLGSFDVIVKQPGVNKKGESVVFERSPADAVAAMKEDDGFLNLFKGGTGGTGSKRRSKDGNSSIPSNTSEYMKQRAAGDIKY